MAVINFQENEAATIDIGPERVIVSAWSKPAADGCQAEKVKRVITDSVEVAEFQHVINNMLEVDG